MYYRGKKTGNGYQDSRTRNLVDKLVFRLSRVWTTLLHTLNSNVSPIHSWMPYAKHRFDRLGRLQGDGGRKFKVGTERVSGAGFRGLERGRGMHLALNSGHDGWFPDVIQWNCAAPSRRLMKTHASSGASQMIPARAYVPHVVAFGSVPLYTLMAFRVQLGCLKIQGVSTNESLWCTKCTVRNDKKIARIFHSGVEYNIAYVPFVYLPASVNISETNLLYH